MQRPFRISRRPALVLATALVLAACGTSTETVHVDTGARPDLPIAAASTASPLPAVTVWDISEQQWVQLANFLPSDKPVLVWLWAPH